MDTAPDILRTIHIDIKSSFSYTFSKLKEIIINTLMIRIKFVCVLLLLLLCSCSARTSIAPDAALKPAYLEGTKAQIMDIAYSAAQKAFPDESYGRDDVKGIIQVYRQWFWRGDTLVTINITTHTSMDSWIVEVASRAVGFNPAIGDFSTGEVSHYLNVLRDEYALSIRAQREKETTMPKTLSQKLQELQTALNNGLISKEEYQIKRRNLIEKY